MKNPHVSLKNDQRGIAMVVEVLLVIAVIVGLSYVGYRVNQNSRTATHNEQIEIKDSQAGKLTVRENEFGDKIELLDIYKSADNNGDSYFEGPLLRFTSDDLGISFTFVYLGAGDDYWERLQKNDLPVKRQDNKLCVAGNFAADSPFGCTGWVAEVFTKDLDESLEAAVNTQILAGYNKKDCYAERYTYGGDSESDKRYQKIGIMFPGIDDPVGAANTAVCPYASQGSMTYFMTPVEKPSRRFVFVAHGHDSLPINADDPTPWQHAIEFLK